MMGFLNRIITVEVADPEDSRKRKLLNILLLGTLGVLVLNLFLLFDPGMWSSGAALPLAFAMAIFFFGISGIYFINRRSGIWAAFLFLLLLTLVVNLSDTPYELSNGRSIFVYTFPIIISSLLLFSSASFIFAIISSLCMAGLAWSISSIPNPLAIIGFFMLALVSWLTTRSLEQALRDLRTININLDRLVEEKTQELARALSREIVLAGRNQTILDSIADGVIVFDSNNVSILANPALEKIIETPFKRLAEIHVSDFVRNKDLSPANQGLIMGLVEHPEKIELGTRVEWGKKTLSVSIARVQDTSQNSAGAGAVAVFRDVTHEAELEKMKSTFVGIVSHELRTPLNAIIGYTEILKEAIYGQLNEKQESVIERITINAKRLLAMVGDLLDEAQMKAGKLSIKRDTFKTAILLENMHTTMDKITTDKGLYLTDELDANMPETMIGDAQRLQQIIINLVNNSAKFTRQGGIHVKITRSDINHWMLEVTDTGQGIPEKEIPFIFDTFRQVENSTTRQHSGFGLGLSIVKQLIELMNGTIAVKSKLEQGSTFTINLPLIEKDI